MANIFPTQAGILIVTLVIQSKRHVIKKKKKKKVMLLQSELDFCSDIFENNFQLQYALLFTMDEFREDIQLQYINNFYLIRFKTNYFISLKIKMPTVPLHDSDMAKCAQNISQRLTVQSVIY